MAKRSRAKNVKTESKKEKEAGSVPVRTDLESFLDWPIWRRGYWRHFAPEAMRRFDIFSQAIPDIDLKDEGNSYRVRADLPGVRKEDVQLHVEKNRFTISARTAKQRETSREGYYYNERHAAGYFRSIPFPSEVIPESAKARMENGTLEFTVDKSEGSKRNVRVD